MRFRLRLIQVILSLCFFIVLLRLGYIQLWCHEELSARVNHQSNRWIRQAPCRGPILDRHGETLAESVRVASCFADPRLVQNRDKAARRLSRPLKMPAQSIKEKIRQAPGSFVWLKRYIPLHQVEILHQIDISGIGLKWEYQRSYPNGSMAAPILGFVGDDGKGLSGVEHIFDDWLLDTRPPRRSLKDGRGANLPLSSLQKGGNATWLRLTLDKTIQYIVERELAWGMNRSQSKSGMVIVQDPWTGEILAMASQTSPSFLKGRTQGKNLSILPVQWVFEPGSTFKLVTAAAALEENEIQAHEVLDCENGKWIYKGSRIKDHTPQKILTFEQVMEVSSNIGMAKAGIRVGKQKLYEYIRAFGFGTRTGCGIPGESVGLLRPPEKWSGISLPVISFGQEVGVTALQLSCAFSVVANGGVLFEPTLFQEVQNQWKKKRVWKKSSQVRRVISEETSLVVKRMLERVVLKGTGYDAKMDGWTVAGKTGTAQKIDPQIKTYSPDKHVASFCGFVPASRPRLTIVVVFDEPEGLYWGGHNAGPVFRRIARHVLTYLGVPSDRNTQRAKVSKKAVGAGLVSAL